MFLLTFLLCTKGELLAVIGISRETSCLPRFQFDWNYEKIGIINDVGIQQAEELGERIRNRYGDVLVKNFDQKSKVFVKNTQCAVSAMEAQLGKIFPDGLVSFKLLEEANDFMLSPEKACKRITVLLERNLAKFEKHEIFQMVLQRKKDLERYIGNFTVVDLYKLGDFIISYEEQGKKSLLELEFEVTELVKLVYYKYHEWILYGSIEQGKLALTELLNKLNSFMKVTFKSNKSQRFLPFMIDEALFLALLHIIGLDYSPKPPGSSLSIELHKIANKNTVRFFFNHAYAESSVCGLECSLQEITEHFQSKTLKYPIGQICLIKGEITENFNFKYLLAAFLLFSMIIVGKYWKNLQDFIKKFKTD